MARDLNDVLRGDGNLADALMELQARPVPPAPLPRESDDAVIVRNAEQAHEAARELVGLGVALAGGAGAGKTTAWRTAAAEALARGDGDAAVLYLPTRETALEKAEAARGDLERIGVATQVLLGRQHDDPDGDWYCSEEQRVRLHADAKQHACTACPSLETCSVRGYRRDFVNALARQDEGPVLYFSTYSAAPHNLGYLPRDAAVCLDDVPGAYFGLVEQVTLDREELQRFRERVEKTLGGGEPADSIKRIVHDLAHAALTASPARSVQNVIEQPGVRDVLRPGLPSPPDGDRWPWESERSTLNAEATGFVPEPFFTRTLLRLGHYTAVAKNTAPRVARNRRAVDIYLPCTPIIERAKKGLLSSLSIGAMPQAVADALEMERRGIHSSPERLRVIYCVLRREDGAPHALGAGDPRPHAKGRPKGPSVGDRAARTLAAALYRKHRDAFGAVMHKADREDPRLEELFASGRAKHYGEGHASTDVLADVDVLLVRRFALPPDAIRRQAEVLCGALDLPLPEAAQLVEDLEQYHEAQFVENAVGRCRPLTANSERLVILATGRDVHGIVGDDVEWDDLPEALGIDASELPEPSTLDAWTAQKNKGEEGRRAAAAILEENPRATSEEIAKGAGISPRTARRYLLELRPVPPAGAHRQLELLRDRVAERREATGREVSFPSARRLAKRVGMHPDTVRGHHAKILAALRQEGALDTPLQRNAVVNRERVLSFLLRYAETLILSRDAPPAQEARHTGTAGLDAALAAVAESPGLDAAVDALAVVTALCELLTEGA